MANRSIEIAINARNNASSALQNITRDLDRMQNTSRAMIDSSKGFLAFGGALVGGLGYATKTAVDFEQSIANVGAVMGRSAGDFADLEKIARETGETTKFSASQSADAMLLLAQKGYEVSYMAEMLNSTVGLASSTNFDLARTTDLVTSTLSSFEKQGYSAEGVSDILAKATNISGASMEKFSTSMSNVAPIAGALGVPLESLTSQLGVLYDSGFKAETASTSLRMAYAQLSKPTGEATKAIEGLGLSLDDMNPATNSMADIIDRLKDSGASAKDIFTIFGTETAPAVTAMMSKGGDAIRDYETALGNASGTMKAMSDTQLSTVAGKLKLLNSQWEEARIAIGQVFIPALIMLMGIISNVLTWFNNLSDGQKKFIAISLAVVAGISLLIGAFLLIGGTIIGFVATFMRLKTLLSGVGFLARLATMFNPIALAISALILVAFALYKAWNSNFMGIQDKTKAVLSWIQDKFTQFKAFVIKKVYELAKDLLEKFNKIMEIKDIVTKAFTGAVIAVGKGILDAYKKITDFKSKFKEGGAMLIKTFASGIAGAVGKAVSAVGGVLSKVRRLLPFSDAKEGALSDLTYSGSQMIDAFSRGVRSADNLLKSSLNSTLTNGINGTVIGGSTLPQSSGFRTRNAQQGFTVNGGITITINDAQNLDEQQLSEQIMREIYSQLNR